MGRLGSLGKWKDNGSIMIFLVRNILIKIVISPKYWEYIGKSWEYNWNIMKISQISSSS
jgi:hypothetical protein